jgi:photosystem II stability/assembly factor-like uncharacterized protein
LFNTATLALLLTLPAADPEAKKDPPPNEKEKDGKPTSPFAGLSFRSIGPALTSGRVVGFAVHPKDRSHYFVAAASGGVWKTTNAGTTWTPVFDGEGSYSIGCVTLDPKNPNVIWVGTGENNSQRSVGYGDGVYKSTDAGKSWQNVGLKASEHIGRILIDPRDSDTVYVAAQGPLWAPGGDRGLYKTTDGGKTWNKVLNISENTGVTDVIVDPRNPDVLIAASYQRRRHVWTLIDGGPESALHRSTDAGKTWTKLKSGLPTEDLGRIGLALAPGDPDVVYAIIEAMDKKGGIFRSADRGVTWEKRNDFDQQAQYYAHLVVDPKNADRLYVMNVQIQVSDDGGKTLRPLGERAKHVDNHEIWIDPNDTNYYLVGCDGGIYESFDRAANWHFKSNLPITQFYDVAVDESGPFYHVYGGTQDNFTLGGPARTHSAHGITNADWYVTQGGDGFHCKVDPKDPNTVYSEMQYGGLVRFDRRTGQKVGIQPQPGPGEPALRWNWDSPLIISPHSNTRLYFAANKLFRSDDRGESWKAISGDLSRELDRDKLPVMGKVWGPDAVAKSVSTSFYGNVTALAESPKEEGLIYAGTDDGLIQITEDGGSNWRKVEKFPGVPERTFVSKLLASQHDGHTVYAAFDNHKMGDFAPYLFKSADAGKTWSSIAGDLPARGSVYAIAEDHVDPDLLFVGTEFALFFTTDGGKKWQRLKSGLPTIQVKDLAIQRKMNDLVVGTFGRGIYILDDYSPLRSLKGGSLEKPATLFPVRDALLYVQSRQYGGRGKAFLGESFFTADNPAFGATFTYFLKEGLKSKKQQRKDAEKKSAAKGTESIYPSKDELRAEVEAEDPQILLTIHDEDGHWVRTLYGPTGEGSHRVAWDLREPAVILPRPRPTEAAEDVFSDPPAGIWVIPGKYQVTLSKRVEGVETTLAGPQAFGVVGDGEEGLNEADRKELHDFQRRVARLQRAVNAATTTANEMAGRLDEAKRAADQTDPKDSKLPAEVRELIRKDRDALRALRGDTALRARNENTTTSISERVGYIGDSQRFALAKPTGTQREQYRIAADEFTKELANLREVEKGLHDVEWRLENVGAPWTPGRLPEWKEK